MTFIHFVLALDVAAIAATVACLWRDRHIQPPDHYADDLADLQRRQAARAAMARASRTEPTS